MASIIDRLKEYLGDDQAPGGTWQVDLAPGKPVAITIGPYREPVDGVTNRTVKISVREIDVFDRDALLETIINKMQTVDAKPQPIELPDDIPLIEWTRILRDG